MKRSIRSVIAFILGLSITLVTIIYPYSAYGISLDDINKKLIELTTFMQKKNSVQSDLRLISNNTNINVSLNIQSNETKSTEEFNSGSNVQLSCNESVSNKCNIYLRVLRKQVTVENYTTYEEIQTHDIELNQGNNTQLNITGQAEKLYVLTLKNKGSNQIQVGYKITRNTNSVKNDVISTINNTKDKITTTNLGRLKFEQVTSNSHIFLLTPKLKRGFSEFTLVPSDIRSTLTFIPLEVDMEISVSVMYNTKEEYIITDKTQSFTIPNPLKTYKGGKIHVVVNVKGSSESVSIIGL